MQKINSFAVRVAVTSLRATWDRSFTDEPSREDILAAIELERAAAMATIEAAGTDTSGDEIDNDVACIDASDELKTLKSYAEIVQQVTDLTPSKNYESVFTAVQVAGTKIGSITITPLEIFSKAPVNADRALQELIA